MHARLKIISLEELFRKNRIEIAFEISTFILKYNLPRTTQNILQV